MSKKEGQTQKQTKPAKVAQKIAKANKKGKDTRQHKVYTSVRFHRPKTLTLARKPRYARRAKALFSIKQGFDKYSVIKHPLNTEKAMKKIEDENTLVFIVDNRATKSKIRDAFTQIYNTKVRSINTLIT
jgi:Ribosomal protein L23